MLLYCFPKEENQLKIYNYFKNMTEEDISKVNYLEVVYNLGISKYFAP